MTTNEYLLYGGIGLTALLCLIAGIVNWLHLIAISSLTSKIEKELEKKTAEFDGLRKEKAIAREALLADGNAPTVPEKPSSQSSQEEVTRDTGTIQVIRNVRGSFEDAQNSHLEQTTLDIAHATAHSESESASDESIPKPSETAILYVPGVQPDQPEPYDSHQQFQDQANVSDGNSVLDVVEEAPQPTPIPLTGISVESDVPDPNATTIVLYSQATKDADFVSAWKAISTALETTEHPHIVLDMANILFLYEKELGYLEKISQLTSLQNGTLSLIHCEQELQGLLNKRQSLAKIPVLS